MTTDYGLITDFNYNDESFQDQLMAEIVDKLAFQSSGLLQEAATIKDDAGDYVVITQYPTVADGIQRIVSNTDLNVYDFSDYKQRAAWMTRGNAWGVEDLVNVIAKKDPIAEIVRQVSNMVAKAVQDSAINALTGIMATELATTHSTGNTYAGGTISYPAILGAKQLLGDSQQQLTIAVGNSKVFNDMAGVDINVFPAGIGNEAARSGASLRLAGMNGWMEDALTVSAGVYSTYFAAPGAVVFKFGGWERRASDGSGRLVKSMIDFEFDRAALTGGGTDIFIFRVKYLVHPLGMQYDATGGTNPTDAVLATGTSWTKVADDNRKIKVVQLKTA